MRKTEFWWIVAGFALQIIALGVSMLLPAYGLLIAFVGLVILIVAGMQLWNTRSAKNMIVDQVAALIPMGESIKQLCLDDQRGKAPEHEAIEWAGNVEGLLTQYGGGYKAVFYLSEGLGDPKIPPMFSAEHRRVALYVSHRLMRIQEFLADVRKS